jgi:hypothetical protein
MFLWVYDFFIGTPVASGEKETEDEGDRTGPSFQYSFGTGFSNRATTPRLFGGSVRGIFA